MGKTSATFRVLRSIVSPALGLSMGALAAAGAAVTGCDRPPSDTSPSAEKPPLPGTVVPLTPAPPSGAPVAPASATDTATPETTAPSSPPAPTQRPPIHPPGLVAPPHQPLPRPGPAPRDPIELPGKRVAPGFAPSSAAVAQATAPLEESARALSRDAAHAWASPRPTRATRRATDPDRRALRGGVTSRGSLV